MKTQLMQSILQSPSAKRIAEWLSPIYGEAYTTLWLLQVIGAQLDKEHDWAEQIRYEVTPQTATWSIELWEKEYGITPESWWTLEQRRQNIVNQAGLFLPMNPRRLEEIAATKAGVPVVITENTGKNKFDVSMKGATRQRNSALDAVDRYKPAHLIYEAFIEQVTELSKEVYVAAALYRQQKKSYEINEWGKKERDMHHTAYFAAFRSTTKSRYIVDDWGHKDIEAETTLHFGAAHIEQKKVHYVVDDWGHKDIEAETTLHFGAAHIEQKNIHYAVTGWGNRHRDTGITIYSGTVNAKSKNYISEGL